ncbi:MAG: hypothetical protein R3B96_23470 [Pirellulaceae bacterium]
MVDRSTQGVRTDLETGAVERRKLGVDSSGASRVMMASDEGDSGMPLKVREVA